jgi:hypothetical protein
MEMKYKCSRYYELDGCVRTSMAKTPIYPKFTIKLVPIKHGRGNIKAQKR